MNASMIDVILINSLLKAVPDNMAIILVGDVDQLLSVGAGKVLSDIIASGVIPVIKLEKIFRHAQKSRSITNAHKINHWRDALSDRSKLRFSVCECWGCCKC